MGGRFLDAWDLLWDDEAVRIVGPRGGHTLRSALSTLEFWADRCERLHTGTRPVPTAPRTLRDEEVVALGADTWDGDYLLRAWVIDAPDLHLQDAMDAAGRNDPDTPNSIHLVLFLARGWRYRDFRTRIFAVVCIRGGAHAAQDPRRATNCDPMPLGRGSKPHAASFFGITSYAIC